MGSYLPSTPEERAAMLAEIGCDSIDELYRNVPQDVRCGELDIPSGLSEMEVLSELERMAGKNTVFRSVFRGAGAYQRYIPALVKTVTSNEAFLTAYTPYQAEIEPGRAAVHLRVPDDGLRAHGHGRLERVAVRRRLRGGRGRAHVRRPQAHGRRRVGRAAP